MLEILISMIILALLLVGLANVFVASGGYMAHSRSRISSSQLGTVFMEPLQNEVRQSDWDNLSSNNLSVSIRNGSTVNLNGVDYFPSYNITNESTGTALRRVQVKIRWNETP